MKYTTEVVISLPRRDVIKKLDTVENLKHWQQGFVDYELLDGASGKEGSTMKLLYKVGKRDMILKETVIKNNFPKEFHATYETTNVYNIQKNYFKEVDSMTTKWISKNEFQFSSFGMKLMGWIMPASFKKQSKKYMTDFKNFVERDISLLKKDNESS